MTKKVSKNVFIIFIVLLGAGLFSACIASSEPLDTGSPTIDEKQGNTTKTGVITEINGSFYFQETGYNPEQIESYSVDLSQYTGRNVTITGQYSGDTLFVGSVR